MFDIHSITLGKDITAEDISEDLEFLDDWEERYRYIIDLGKQLPELPDELKTCKNIIGCSDQQINQCLSFAEQFTFL